MNFSTILKYLYNHLDFVLSLCASVVFLIVNIIQAVRSHDKKKLKDAICRIPEIIRQVEVLFGKKTDDTPLPLPPEVLSADLWSVSKKSTAEAMLKNIYGDKFFNKYIKELDIAIEDILNTPQKKGEKADVI